MTAPPDALATLEERFRHMDAVGGALEILAWDQQVTMPPGGAEARGRQLAALQALQHQALTAPDMSDLLAAAEEASLTPDQGRNLALMRHAWRRAVAVPAALVEERALAATVCETAWREARTQDDFSLVAEPFARVLAAVRAEAEALASVLGGTPYDALLDAYEPGLTTATVERVFAELEQPLADLLPAALAHQGTPPPAPVGPFAPAAQEALARRLMVHAGFDFRQGRLDTAAHPFCGGGPTDIRITTRYDEHDFLKSLMGVLHETGHGLYEGGLPVAWRGQPAGQAAGMAVHESQSLLFEMQAGRSEPFLAWLAPQVAAAFGEDWTVARLTAHARAVVPGAIRVDADEVTYPRHVLLRTTLERALLSRDLTVADLPGAFRDGLARGLGVRVDNDREGCLQDIHWYDGAFGYFPTYTLGALAAAQFFQAARAAVPEMRDALGRGDFAPLLGWLRAHVHNHGRLRSLEALLAAATGRPLDSAAWVAHIRERYTGAG